MKRTTYTQKLKDETYYHQGYQVGVFAVVRAEEAPDGKCWQLYLPHIELFLGQQFHCKYLNDAKEMARRLEAVQVSWTADADYFKGMDQINLILVAKGELTADEFAIRQMQAKMEGK